MLCMTKPHFVKYLHVLTLACIILVFKWWGKFCNFLQVYYNTTARELARMVRIQKAPIVHHFSESISGASTIRCFNQEKVFSTKAMALVDDYSRVAFHNYATMEWLSESIFSSTWFSTLSWSSWLLCQDLPLIPVSSFLPRTSYQQW